MMTSNPLAQNRVFSHLDKTALQKLSDCAQARQFQSGDWIVHNGDVWSNLFFIRKGKVTAIKESPEGRSLTLATFTEGEIFWGLAFFIENAPCPPRSRRLIIVNYYYGHTAISCRSLWRTGGYLPFELDVTSAARAGTNTLTVRVDDPPEIFAEIPHGKQSWYGTLSGIWQSVWVESRAATHIQRVKISTDGEQVSVSLSVRGELADGLKAEVIAPNGTTIARAESDAPRFSIRIQQPLAWSPDEPNLYTLKVSMPDDEVSETFGFRTIETRDGKILLNGRPFYMRSALDQDYYPDLICTPPSQEYIEDEFRKTKEMGLNCLRIHIKVADPRYYAAADKVGLLIWTELPNHILLSDEAKRRARETLAGMLERDWNHPSIGIWTIINESWGIDLTDPSQRAWLAETYAWLKSLDPTRLVVGNSAC